MAKCGECAWWKLYVFPEEEALIRRMRRGACRFPVNSILPASVDGWSLIRFGADAVMLEREGTDCPQFKEREDVER